MNMSITQFCTKAPKQSAEKQLANQNQPLNEPQNNSLFKNGTPKKSKISTDTATKLQSTPALRQIERNSDWNNWSTIVNSRKIQSPEESNTIETVRLEIKNTAKDRYEYNFKEHGYKPFTDAYKMGAYLDVLPITPEQILDRKKFVAAPAEVDLKKSYVAAFDKIGRSWLIDLSDAEAERMYHITEDEDGRKVYKVNIAFLTQMSGKRYTGPRKLKESKNKKSEKENHMEKNGQPEQAQTTSLSENDEECKEPPISKKVFESQSQIVKNQPKNQIPLSMKVDKKQNGDKREIKKLKSEFLHLNKRVENLEKENANWKNELQKLMKMNENFEWESRRMDNIRDVSKKLFTSNNLSLSEGSTRKNSSNERSNDSQEVSPSKPLAGSGNKNSIFEQLLQKTLNP